MSETAPVVSRLLAWFAGHERDLPWRRAPEPWRVLVAETMLQQTRIATVVPRYEAFLARFPDPAAMADAAEDDVLALWSGLGYYRRARNLHAAAREILARHGGRVPDDPKALKALPGVGDYTAGAVLSIAFGRPEPIVDGNVERILTRIFLLRGSVKRGETKKRLWAVAREMVAAGPPARVNQAMMELGALICLPRSPRCPECPVAGACRARAAGVAEELPELPPKREPVDVPLAVAVAATPEGVLLVRTPAGGFLAGTWAPPFARVENGAAPARAVEAAAYREHGIELRAGRSLGTVTHGITHHRIAAEVFAATLAAPPAGPDAALVPPARYRDYGLSSLARKALRLAPEK